MMMMMMMMMMMIRVTTLLESLSDQLSCGAVCAAVQGSSDLNVFVRKPNDHLFTNKSY